MTMKQTIPDHEKWLHTPEMKAKLTRADEWAKSTPPRETDLGELERQLEEHHGSTHITPAGANIFLDLGFPPDEAAALMAETARRIAEARAKKSAGYIVLHLLMDFEFVPIGSHRPIMNIIERHGWKPYDLGGDYVYIRADSTTSDALDLLQSMKTELPWFHKALEAAWASEVLKMIDLKEVLSVPLTQGDIDE